MGHAAVKELKKNLIVNALEQARGNYTEAARILGVHANYLHRLIRNFELRGFSGLFPRLAPAQAADREVEVVRGRDVVASLWQLEFH